jgi:hypothetical protein
VHGYLRRDEISRSAKVPLQPHDDRFLANSGTESAILFACHITGVAFAYLVDRRGAAFTFTELTHSEQVRDAIAREVAKNQ